MSLRVNDKAGADYWDKTWRVQPLPTAVSLKKNRLNNYVFLSLDQYFRNVFFNWKCAGRRLLEIGAARSLWLPYFAREFGFKVCGLDRSEAGCEQAKEILKYQELCGDVVCGDLAFPPNWMLGSFDVVVSFGVVEHFDPPEACLKACARFLKPGGLIITIIPNLSGLLGHLQKVLDRDIFNMHVIMNRNMFLSTHKKAGLKVLDCRYLMSANWCLAASGKFESNPLNFILRKVLSGLSKAFWLAEKRGIRIQPNRLTSPYIACLATNTQEVRGIFLEMIRNMKATNRAL